MRHNQHNAIHDEIKRELQALANNGVIVGWNVDNPTGARLQWTIISRPNEETKYTTPEVKSFLHGTQLGRLAA